MGLKAQVAGSPSFYLQKSKDLLSDNADSSLYYLREWEKVKTKPASTREFCESRFTYSDAYRNKGDLTKAVSYLLEARKVLDGLPKERFKDPSWNKIRIEAEMKMGVIQLQLGQFDKSLDSFQIGLKRILAQKSSSGTKILDELELKAYNNIAAVYLRQEKFEKALRYFQSALESNALEQGSTIESSLLNNSGICFLEMNDIPAAQHCFEKALDIRIRTNDWKGQAQTLNNIGKSYAILANFEQAAKYFEKSLQLGRQTRSKESIIVSLESLSSVHDTLGNYRKALKYFKEFKILKDSLLNADVRLEIANLEANHQKQDHERKMQLQIQQRKHERLIARINIYALVGILVLLFMILMMTRTKMKNTRLLAEKLTWEKEHLSEENSKLEEDIGFKDRELTVSSLTLVQYNELVQRMLDHLNKLKTNLKGENLKMVQDMVHHLKSQKNSNLWEEFEVHFTNVHPHFYPRLLEQFPGLTPNEKKLCAFLRMNLSSKDMSTITGQSVNSITVARSRLRKKLNIEGEDIQLINFLMEI